MQRAIPCYPKSKMAISVSSYGGRYTIKLNPHFDPIELDEFDDYKTMGIFKCVL